MKQNILIGVLAIAAIGILGTMTLRSSPAGGANTHAAGQGAAITLYKSPSCGCCGEYTAYLRGKDYAVDVQPTESMAAIKEKYGVPYELESCHTMTVAGYVVEGHVPEEAIQKLLAEKPDVKGIGMAGMPSGSPGMPGPKNESFVIHEITHEGEQGEVFMTI